MPRGTTISGPYYASIIERLRCIILKKRRSKVSHRVVLLHTNVPVHKYNIVRDAIRKTGFIQLDHPVYSPGIAPSDYYLFSTLRKFLRGKNFSRDDKTIDTVEDYLNKLD